MLHKFAMPCADRKTSLPGGTVIKRALSQFALLATLTSLDVLIFRPKVRGLSGARALETAGMQKDFLNFD